MTQRERRGWILVGGLFATLFLVFGGGYNTSGVFFTPLLKNFGWSRAQLSTLTGALAISAGVSAPLIGWLLDRIEARLMIVAGTLMVAGAFFCASRSNSFTPMLASYLLLGVGIGAATLLPCAMVIANWFGPQNRGLAMGITFMGTSLGGAGMTLVANHAIESGGWRAGYIALAIPMVVVVIPIALALVKTRPHESSGKSVREMADGLAGFELKQALSTRSFWMVALAQFLYATVAAGTNLHLITHLIGLGYEHSFAARMFSLVLVMAAVGKLTMGVLADYISARIALAANFVIATAAMILVFQVANPSALYVFVVIFGFSVGAPLVLIPLLTVEAMGLKRFGSIGGIAGIANTIGAAVGPIGAGRIFDATHSYSTVFETFLVLSMMGVIATYACRSFETEQSRMVAEPAAA
jgi:sugar phosphate permease